MHSKDILKFMYMGSIKLHLWLVILDKYPANQPNRISWTNIWQYVTKKFSWETFPLLHVEQSYIENELNVFKMCVYEILKQI